MYYPQEPKKEPSGCLQSLLISRAILAILLVPIGLIVGGILAVIFTFYAFTVSPFLGFGVIIFFIVALISLGKWEARRVAKEIPRDDQ